MSPEQFHQLANLISEPLLLASGEGVLLAANRAAGSRLGLCPSALSGQPLAGLLADPPAEVAHYLSACARTAEPIPGSLVLRRADGEEIPCRCEGAVARPRTGDTPAVLLLRMVPRHDTPGQFAVLTERIEALTREVARRTQVEAELREQREWLSVTLSSIGDAVVATDEAGCILFMNAVAQSLTGWEAEAATGRPLTEVFRIVNEETRVPVENPVAEVLREGHIVGLANHTVLLSRDGTEWPIDDSAAPIRDASGKLIGVVLIFREITQRKQIEAELRQRAEQQRRHQEWLEEALNQLPTPMLFIEPGTARVTFANRAADALAGGTFPRGKDAAHYHTVYYCTDANGERIPDEGMPGVRVARGERLDGFEMDWHLPQGVRSLIVWADTLPPLHGHPAACLLTFHDVTHLKSVEAELRQANRAKDQFLAMLAHELRNPLAPILNAVQIMRARPDRDTGQWAREIIGRQVRHLSRLVDDLLDVSRITRGTIELQVEPLDLVTVVEEAVEAVVPLVETCRHQLSVSLPPETVCVEGDRTRLVQVLGNLLTNAAKYTEPDGRIWLTAEREAGELVIRVRDTGVGIAAEALPHVFDLFMQVD
ncbi:MAG TPA: PAS domain-containing protein, partial [Armatimonadota bacterium]|nr:PAS domain-containing protein [Armatimonadota bacterium]